MADETANIQEHEKKNEGGREYGRVHEPTQAQEASGNAGLADQSKTKSEDPKESKTA